MAGKTVLITGSTDGVGRYVAAKLAATGAKVLIHGRDQARAGTFADQIAREGHAEPVFYQADLSSLSGARRLADAVIGDKAAGCLHQQRRHRRRRADGERRESADGTNGSRSITCRTFC